jgi:hypothetical protein
VRVTISSPRSSVTCAWSCAVADRLRGAARGLAAAEREPDGVEDGRLALAVLAGDDDGVAVRGDLDGDGAA